MEIRQAVPQDAKELLEYLKIVGGETDNLTFGSEGLPVSAEDEERFIQSTLDDDRSVMLLACEDGNILGNGSLMCMSRRMSHRAGLALTVKRSEWDKGIGSALMRSLIDQAVSAGIEMISLEVRYDNERAIHLYEKFGFTKIGTFPAFLKIDDEDIDCEIMVLDLRG